MNCGVWRSAISFPPRNATRRVVSALKLTDECHRPRKCLKTCGIPLSSRLLRNATIRFTHLSAVCGIRVKSSPHHFTSKAAPCLKRHIFLTRDLQSVKYIRRELFRLYYTPMASVDTRFSRHYPFNTVYISKRMVSHGEEGWWYLPLLSGCFLHECSRNIVYTLTIISAREGSGSLYSSHDSAWKHI
jgi:hypothetical protein